MINRPKQGSASRSGSPEERSRARPRSGHSPWPCVVLGRGRSGAVRGTLGARGGDVLKLLRVHEWARPSSSREDVP